MAQLTGHLLYFAYGEDLPHGVLKRACPGAEWFGPARLEGFRLASDATGRANVKPEEGGVVWGALWLVPASEAAGLEARATGGFARTSLRIVSPAGPRTEATVYVSASGDEGRELTEVAAMLVGAKENRLPAAYIEQLKRSGKPRKDSR